MSRISAGTRTRSISLLLAAAVLAPAARGAVIFKDVTTTDMNAVGSWSTASGAATPDPASIGATDTLRFNEYFAPTAGTTYTASLTANLSVGAIRLDSGSGGGGSATGNVTIDGSYTLTLSGNTDYTTGLVQGIVLNSATGGSLTISANLALGASQRWVASRNLTVSGNVALGANNLTFYSAGGTTSVSGIISGTGGIIRDTSNAGAVVLSGNNTYTGTTSILTGIIKVTGSGALGGTGASLSTTDAGNLVFGGAANGSQALEFETAANLGLINQVRFRNTSGTAGTGGALRYIGTTAQTVNKIIQCDTGVGIRLESSSVGGSVDFAGSWSGVSGGRPVYLGGTGTGDNKISANIAGASILTKRDAGKWILSGTNNTLTGVAINGGTLGVAKLANGGSSSSLGSSTNAAANLVFNGGWLAYVGSGDSTDRAFTVTGTGLALSSDGTGALTWTSAVSTAFTTANTAYTFKLGGANTGANVFGTVIANNGTGAISLTKQDAGTWALTGNNTYSGTTTLSAGTLQAGGDSAFGTSTLALNGGTLSSNGATGRSLSNAVTIGGDVTLGSGSNSGALTFGSTVGLGSAVRVLTVASDVAFSGVVSAGGLTKAGNGKLTLSGDNSYVGGTIVNAGTLALGAANRLADGGALTVNTGGTFDLGGYADTVAGMTLAGGTVTNGTLTASSYDVRSGTISGAIAGSGTLTKSTSATATLSGTSTFSGATQVNNGTLVVSGSLSGSAVSVANAATLSITGTLTGGSLSVASGGLATVAATGSLSGNTVSVSGLVRGTGNAGAVTLANGGTLEVGLSGLGNLTATSLSVDASAVGILSILNVGNYTSTNVALTVGNVTFASGGTLRFDISGAAGIGEYSLVAYSGSLDTTSITSSAFSPGNRKSATLNFDTPGLIKYVVTGTQPKWIGSTSDWSGAAAWSIGPLETDTDIFQSGDSLVFDDTAASGAINITADVDPSSLTFSGNTLDYTLTGAGGVITSGALIKSGSAKLTLVAANTFSGGSTVSGGRVRVADNSALGSGTVTLSGAALSSDGTTARTLANNLILAGAATLGDANDTGALTLTGTVDLGGADRSLTTASNVVLQGVVSAGGITKLGNATLTLTGANIYASGTTVTAGRIRVGSATALGSGAVTLNGGVISSDSTTARTLANSLVFAADASLGEATDTGALTFSGSVDLGGAVRTLTTISDVTLSGVIATGGLSKLGSGTLTLSGVGSTYASGTTVSAGTLALGASNVLANAGAVTVDGGTFSIGAYSDTIGALSLSAGSVTGGAGQLTASSVSVSNASGTTTISAVLAGSGALTKTGNGTLSLTGSSTYTGGTNVNAGTLSLGHATNTLANTGAVNVAGGTLAVGANSDTIGALSLSAGAITGTGTLTAASVSATNATAASISAILAGTGSLAKSGNGTLTLTGANSYTGATTVSAGTLQVGSGGAAGDIGSTGAGSATNLVTVSSGATLRFSRTGTLDYKNNARMRAVTGAGDIVLDGGVKLFNYTGSGLGFDEANSWSTFSGRLVILGGSEFQTIRNGRTAMGSAQIVLGDATTSGILSQVEGSWTWTNNIRLDGSANIIRNNSANTPRSLKIQGVVSGSGNVTFADATGGMNTGDLGFILTGANTLGGQVTVDTFVRVGGVGGDSVATTAGTSGSLGSASVVINSGKTLTFSRSDTHTVGNALSGAGAVRIGSTGISGSNTQDITLSAANTYTGGTELLQGTLRVGSLDNLGTYTTGNTGYLAVRNGSTFVFSGTGDVTTFRNLLLDAGAATLSVSDAAAVLTWSDSSAKGGAGGGLITKTGNGTLVLSGAITGGGSAAVRVSGGTLRLSGTNTYTGATTIDNGGTLDISGAGVLDSTTALTVNGTLGFSTSSNQTLTSAMSGTGSLLKSGSGTLTLSANSTGFTGNAAVSGGVLALGHASGLGGALVSVNAGGTLDLGLYAATNSVAVNGGMLTNYANWTGNIVVNYAGATGSAVDAALATYGRSSVTVQSGGSLGLAGLTRNVIFEGGSLTGDYSGYTGDLTVRGALSFAGGSTSGKVILDGGSVDLSGGLLCGSTTHFRSGSLVNAGNFTGDIVLDNASNSLVAGTLGAGQVVLGAGKTLTLGTGFANRIRLTGGTLVGDTLNNLTGTLTVAAGNTLDLDGAGTTPIVSNTGANLVVESGSTLKGNGAVGAITVQAGGILAPGNSPGLIEATSMKLYAGSMNFEVAAVVDVFGGAPVAGTDHDTVTVTGQLDLSSLSTTSRFVLNLISIPESELNPVPTGWDPAQGFELTLFSYGSLYLGDNAAITSLFAIDSTNFLGADGLSVGLAHFSIRNDTELNQVRLVYSTVPEPSTYGLMLGGLAIAAAAYRRKRAKTKA